MVVVAYCRNTAKEPSIKHTIRTINISIETAKVLTIVLKGWLWSAFLLNYATSERGYSD